MVPVMTNTDFEAWTIFLKSFDCEVSLPCISWTSSTITMKKIFFFINLVILSPTFFFLGPFSPLAIFFENWIESCNKVVVKDSNEQSHAPQFLGLPFGISLDWCLNSDHGETCSPDSKDWIFACLYFFISSENNIVFQLCDSPTLYFLIKVLLKMGVEHWGHKSPYFELKCFANPILAESFEKKYIYIIPWGTTIASMSSGKTFCSVKFFFPLNLRGVILRPLISDSFKSPSEILKIFLPLNDSPFFVLDLASSSLLNFLGYPVFESIWYFKSDETSKHLTLSVPWSKYASLAILASSFPVVKKAPLWVLFLSFLRSFRFIISRLIGDFPEPGSARSNPNLYVSNDLVNAIIGATWPGKAKYSADFAFFVIFSKKSLFSFDSLGWNSGAFLASISSFLISFILFIRSIFALIL